MALAWLRNLLSGVAGDKEGTIDIDTLSTAIEEELPKHTAPKEDYEQAIKDRDEAQTKVVSLNGTDIAQLQQALEEERAGRLNDKRNLAIDSVLNEVGVIDPDYIKFKLGDTSELFDGENLKDRNALLESIKKDYPTQIKEKGNGYVPPAGNNGNAKPAAKSLEEAIAAYYES